MKCPKCGVVFPEGDFKISVNAGDFNKAAVLLRALATPIINKEKFRILVEKDPESKVVRFTYLFE